MEKSEHYKFKENIAISYTPYANQMPLRAEEVFYFKENTNNYIIMSKKDYQACYIISKSQNIDSIKNMTVED